MTKLHRSGTNGDKAENPPADPERLDAVRQAVRTDSVPNRAQPLTKDDLKVLREDPALAELAEVAEQYVS